MMIQGADLFCGAGGLTNAMVDALKELGYSEEEISLVCINHWDIAIATHEINHPYATHLQTGVDQVDPWQVVPGRHLDILVAGPQCTFFSRARAGRPKTDQQRVSPWMVVDWLEKLDVTAFIIENVPELADWGPVDPETGNPIKKKKGTIFNQYLKTLRSLGYFVSWKVLNCADYGDPTTRQRLFILGHKKHRIQWPEPTHVSPKLATPLFETRKHWVPAREVIDWTVKGTSIYKRKKPLAPNTLRRIEAGLRKYSGLPFIIGQQSGAAPRSVEYPVPTVATAGAISMIEPYLIKMYGSSNAADINAPMPTITAEGEHIGLAQPFLIPYRSERVGQNGRSHSIDEPVPTVTTINGLGLVQPFIMSMEHSFLVETIHGGDHSRVYSLDDPFKTITTVDAWAIAQPYLIKYNGTATAASVDEPMPTITTKDRFGIAQPMFFKVHDQLYMLDILFRMLMYHELAAAMSFPKNYHFVGKREDKVKQIGNSVPRKTGMALVMSLLRSKK